MPVDRRPGRRVRRSGGVRGSALVSVAVLVAAGVAACTGPADDGVAPVEETASASASADAARLVPHCPPAPAERRATSAAHLNAGVASAGLPGWQAADIGASARLSDGRIVWLFGDTVRKAELVPRIVANSMLVSSGGCVSQLVDPAHGPVIPDAGPHTVRWPMSVVVGRSGGADVVVVLCSRIDRGDGGAFGFTYLGTSAAVFTVEPGAAPELVRVEDITPSSRDPQQVNWGSAATVRGAWLYVYGTRTTGRPGETGRELYVARAPLASPGARGQWRFWDGGGWQPRSDRAAAVLPAADGVSQTLSVDVVADRFVAVSKRGGDVAGFVYEWTADDPWGPWQEHREVPAPAGFDTGDLEYAPLAHPEVLLRSGRLLVSVSRNTTDLQRLLRHPEVGRPYFVEVSRAAG